LVGMSTSVIRLEFKNYFIRSLNSEDINDKYLEWINDTEINQFLEAKYITWTLESLREYVSSFSFSKNKFIFSIHDIANEKYIGNASISSVNYNTETFSFGLFIGDKSYWGKNAAFEASMLLLRFGFEDLGMRKVFGGCYSNQLASRFVMKRIGMEKEARLKEKYKHNGAYVDQMSYSLHQDDWAKTKEKHGLR
jgi:ribosomal-protein-alanine N-acetyltransferase